MFITSAIVFVSKILNIFCNIYILSVYISMYNVHVDLVVYDKFFLLLRDNKAYFIKRI